MSPVFYQFQNSSDVSLLSCRNSVRFKVRKSESPETIQVEMDKLISSAQPLFFPTFNIPSTANLPVGAHRVPPTFRLARAPHTTPTGRLALRSHAKPTGRLALHRGHLFEHTLDRFEAAYVVLHEDQFLVGWFQRQTHDAPVLLQEIHGFFELFGFVK